MYDSLAYRFPQQAVVQSRITEQIFSRVSNNRALYIKDFFFSLCFAIFGTNKHYKALFASIHLENGSRSRSLRKKG